MDGPEARPKTLAGKGGVSRLLPMDGLEKGT